MRLCALLFASPRVQELLREKYLAYIYLTLFKYNLKNFSSFMKIIVELFHLMENLIYTIFFVLIINIRSLIFRYFYDEF